MKKQDEFMDEAADLVSRAGVRIDAEDDKSLGLLLDVIHHLELGRMVVLKEHQGEVELLAYD